MEPQALQPSSLIQSIDIDELFGQFRYRIRSDASLRGDNQLLLLYGDNGAGKSTILNILFHLLHPEPYEGHRSAVGPIPFRSVKIVLTSGYIVTADKHDPFDQSSYCLRLYQPGSDTVIEHLWESGHQGREHTTSDYTQYCEILQNIGLAFHFLSDTRRVAGVSETSNEDSLAQRVHAHMRRERFHTLRERERTTTEAEVVVGEAVDRTLEGLRGLALTGDKRRVHLS